MSLWPGGRVPAAGENPSSNICAAADLEGVAGGLIFPLRSQTSVQTNQSMLVAWTDKKYGLDVTGMSRRKVGYLRMNVLGNTTQRVNNPTKAAAATIISIIDSRPVLMVLISHRCITGMLPAC